MGFSGIVSQVMLIFTVIGMTALILVTYRSYVTQTNMSLAVQEQQLQGALNTNILIENATYNATGKEISLTVKNTGSQTLSPDHIDVFVDRVRIPRSTANRTMALVPETNLVNPTLFDPEEELNITIFRALSPGNHLVEVVTSYGIRNADIITAT